MYKTSELIETLGITRGRLKSITISLRITPSVVVAERRSGKSNVFSVEDFMLIADANEVLKEIDRLFVHYRSMRRGK